MLKKISASILLAAAGMGNYAESSKTSSYILEYVVSNFSPRQHSNRGIIVGVCEDVPFYWDTCNSISRRS